MENKHKGMQHGSRCWTEADVELQKPGNQLQKTTANDGRWTSPMSCQQESLSTEVLTSQRCSYSFWCFLLEYQSYVLPERHNRSWRCVVFLRLSCESNQVWTLKVVDQFQRDTLLKQILNWSRCGTSKTRKQTTKDNGKWWGTNKSNILPTRCKQQTCVHQ